jgi:hypothetical protein
MIKLYPLHKKKQLWTIQQAMSRLNCPWTIRPILDNSAGHTRAWPLINILSQPLLAFHANTLWSFWIQLFRPPFFLLNHNQKSDHNKMIDTEDFTNRVITSLSASNCNSRVIQDGPVFNNRMILYFFVLHALERNVTL